MACGCGKGRMSRPSSSVVTPQPSAQSRQTSQATVITASTPYSKQANTAPAHLQNNLRRTV